MFALLMGIGLDTPMWLSVTEVMPEVDRGGSGLQNAQKRIKEERGGGGDQNPQNGMMSWTTQRSRPPHVNTSRNNVLYSSAKSLHSVN